MTAPSNDRRMTRPLATQPRAAWAMLALLFAALTGLGFGISQPAQAQLSPGGEVHIKSELVPETRNVAAGDTVTLAFAMTPDDTWHGYWKNPGDAGIGMSVEWTLPEGAEAGELQYQVPHRLLIAGIMNYVYEGPYAVLVDVTIPEGLAEGTRLPIAASADWLACTDEICVPESGNFATELVVGAVSGAPNASFEGYRSALPAPLGSTATFEVADNRFRLAIPYPAEAAIDDPYFFPETDGIVDYGAEQSFWRDGDMLYIETAARGDGEALTGLLKIGEDQGLALSAEPGTVDIAGQPLGGVGEDSDGGNGGGGLALFAAAFGGAILGGLILNIMPCVFPILSLKALSLAKSGGGESTAKREALAYTGGIVLVCLALGGTMLALRAGGDQIGWAFQLQDPRIVFLLLVLVTAIAFNLAGLFELPSFAGGSRLADKGGTQGAFWTGALAAFVATPCSGPFMAVAIGSALVLPPAAALLVFAGLGLGLALPFLAIGFVPALRRRIPKPGPWMATLRKILAIPMFLTALALVWLLGQQVDNGGVAMALGATLLVALALWWLGGQQHGGTSGDGNAQWLPTSLAVVFALAGMVALPISMDGKAQANANAGSAETLASEPFESERLASLRGQGTPVFAYFTADWCITCKINEAAALQRKATVEAFDAAGVVVLKGDWTRRDGEITRFLEKHGRSGVPLYVYYGPGKDAEILPQALTVSTLTSLVKPGTSPNQATSQTRS